MSNLFNLETVKFIESNFLVLKRVVNLLKSEILSSLTAIILSPLSKPEFSAGLFLTTSSTIYSIEGVNGNISPDSNIF